MANYVLIYTGGSGGGTTDEERDAIMAAWGAWYGRLGDAIVDGGNPFGASRHVSGSGVGDGAASAPPATGYTVIAAESLDAAVALVQDHPHLADGGQVTVYETFQM